MIRNFTQGPVNMYNCPVVTVTKSTFENNHALSVFTDLPSRVSGGGLSVTIYDVNNSSVTKKTISYTIQNCTFSNNSANSTAPTTDTISILEGGHLNGRGGGVAIYVVHPSVVEIKVLHCNFTNNSASAYGGGLYIFTPEVDTEEDFIIADNHFEGNVAAVGGGGIAVGAVFLQKIGKEYLNKTVLKTVVLFSKNMFVQNKGNRGGAMFLGPGGWVVCYNTHCLLNTCKKYSPIYDFGGVYETVCTPERCTLVSVYIILYTYNQLCICCELYNGIIIIFYVLASTPALAYI